MLPPSPMPHRPLGPILTSAAIHRGLLGQIGIDIELHNPNEDDGELDTASKHDITSPGALLHALTGIRTEDTMQLHVIINGILLLALLDTVSTHNFIDRSMANPIQLGAQPSRGLHITVAEC